MENKNNAVWFGLLIILIGFSRHLPLDYPELFNFSPVLAIFLVSGIFLKGWFAWAAPLFGVIISDIILSKTYDHGFFEPFMIASLLSYVTIFYFAQRFVRKKNLYSIALSSIGASLFFHCVTCSFSWLANPFYPKNPSGLIQAIFLGETGYAPAYLFLRNSIFSTLFFSLCLTWFASFLIVKTKSEDRVLVANSNPRE